MGFRSHYLFKKDGTVQLRHSTNKMERLRRSKGMHVREVGHSGAVEEVYQQQLTGSLNLRTIVKLALIFRWVNALLVRSSFVPDEYWQSLEVAHRMAFGYGYLTWEWTTALRGYTYPAIFAVLFKGLECMGLDNPTLLILLPRVLQGTFSAGQDVALYMLSWQLYGRDVARWTLFCHMTSWFGFYTATRTLTNTMESVCTTVALLYYPWPGTMKRFGGSLTKCILLAALATVVRPTAAVIWVPLSIWHLGRSHTWFSDIWSKYLPVGVAVLLGSCCVDRVFYGEWVLVQYNFLKFNVFSGLGGIYGTHPWHWYLTQGVPVVLGAHLPLVLLGARDRRLSPLLLLVAWVIFVYSLLSHKEFRFILPVLPICMMIAGSYLSQCGPLTKKISVVLLLVNIPVALYTGLVHQRGTVDVMSYMQQELRSEVNRRRDVLFLMPCHSTPFFSHLHIKANLRFLTCEPNLDSMDGYVDEADVFYRDPVRWLQEFHTSDCNDYADYVVMFDVLREKIATFMEAGEYKQDAEFFHTHFPEGRVGSHVLVFHRSAGAIKKRPNG